MCVCVKAYLWHIQFKLHLKPSPSRCSWSTCTTDCHSKSNFPTLCASQIDHEPRKREERERELDGEEGRREEERELGALSPLTRLIKQELRNDKTAKTKRQRKGERERQLLLISQTKKGGKTHPMQQNSFISYFQTQHKIHFPFGFKLCSF